MSIPGKVSVHVSFAIAAFLAYGFAVVADQETEAARIIGREVPRLGAGALMEREDAEEALRALLVGQEERDDDAGLSASLRALESHRGGSPDSEIQERLGRLIAEFSPAFRAAWKAKLPGDLRGVAGAGEFIVAWGGSSAGPGWAECFQAQTGKLRWSVKGSDLPGGLLSVQPEADGIYLGGADSAGRFWLRKLDAGSGRTLWDRPSQEPIAAAPRMFRVAGSRVFLGGGEPKEDGWLSALDLQAGKTVWRTETGALPGGVDALELVGQRLLLRGADAKGSAWIAACDLENGKTVWMRKPGEIPRAEGYISAWDENRIALGGNSESHGCEEAFSKWLEVYDVRTGKTLWKYGEGSLSYGRVKTIHCCGENLFAGGEDWVGLYDAATGIPVWKAKSQSTVFTLALQQRRFLMVGAGVERGDASGALTVAPRLMILGAKDGSSTGMGEFPPLPSSFNGMRWHGKRLFAWGEEKGETSSWLQCYRCRVPGSSAASDARK